MITTFSWVCAGLAASLFIAAESLRFQNVSWATHLSQAGWCLWLGLVAIPFLKKRLLPDLTRWFLLTLVSFTVLAVYYFHAHLNRAGIDGDATYTLIGLHWFLEGHNPLTFAAATYSYPQFPLMFLIHLPAVLIGFVRLGCLSMVLGPGLGIAAILAGSMLQLSKTSWRWQFLLTAALSAAIANRFFLQATVSYMYSIPALLYGLMFLLSFDFDEQVDARILMLSHLLAISLLFYYTSFLFALPLALIQAYRVRHRITHKDLWKKHRLLLGAATLALATLSIHPHLLSQRVQDVSVKAARPGTNYSAKIHEGWVYLKGPYFPSLVTRWTNAYSGSWHFVNLPPLGKGLWALLLFNLALSIAVTKRHRVWWAVFIVATALMTLGLMLASDWEDKRLATFVWPLMLSSFYFVYRIPVLKSTAKFALSAYLIFLAIWNAMDVKELRGKYYGYPGYAYRTYNAMEDLKHASPRLSAISVAATADPFFPAHELYENFFLLKRNIRLSWLPSTEICAPLMPVDLLVLPTSSFLHNSEFCPDPIPPMPGIQTQILSSVTTLQWQRVNTL